MNSKLAPHDYFGSENFLAEKVLFEKGQYVGHKLMVPNHGDYQVVPWDQSKMLVNQAGTIWLVSNVCSHRQAIMMCGSGNCEKFVCPIHRWSYELSGALRHAPKMDEDSVRGLHLSSHFLDQWNGMLFTDSRPVKELSKISIRDDFNFMNFQHDKTEIRECNYNWKTFMEVFLELYHVDYFHEKLSSKVDCNDFTAEYGDSHCVQIVPVRNHLPKLPRYNNWGRQEEHPKYGAVWISLYPNLTIEWYPSVLVISQVIPVEPTRTINVVEFYYPQNVIGDRKFVEAQQEAYSQTAKEDDEICERMDTGRMSMFREGIADFGPYQSPLEDAMFHFHKWWMKATDV